MIIDETSEYKNKSVCYYTKIREIVKKITKPPINEICECSKNIVLLPPNQINKKIKEEKKIENKQPIIIAPKKTKKRKKRRKTRRLHNGKNVDINNNNNNADIALSQNIEISQTIKIDPKKKENTGDDLLKRSDTISTSTEKKFAKKMFDFETNLNCDLFAEEFISYEGIKYLLSFLESASGNICSYALKTLNRLLDFQSSNDYINKSKLELQNKENEIIKKRN